MPTFMPPNKARMSTTNDINWWQQKAEELRLQVHLGRKEAAEAYEQQKKEMGSWAADLRYKLERAGGESSHHLRQRLEELELQAALGKAETRDALKEQQVKLDETLHKVEEEVRAFVNQADDAIDEFADKAEETLQHWHMRMDLFRLQAHLGAKEVGEELSSAKKKVLHKIEEINNILETSKRERKSGWETLKTDLGRSWEDLKSIF